VFEDIKGSVKKKETFNVAIYQADLCLWLLSKAIMQAVPCSPEALKDVALCPNLGVCSRIKIASITVPASAWGQNGGTFMNENSTVFSYSTLECSGLVNCHNVRFHKS